MQNQFQNNLIRQIYLVLISSPFKSGNKRSDALHSP